MKFFILGDFAKKWKISKGNIFGKMVKNNF